MFILDRLRRLISYRQFKSNLASVVQCLTSLDIFFSRRGTHIPSLSETLADLPNLTSLRYDVEQVEDSPPTIVPISLSHPTRLRKVALRAEEEKINGIELQKLLINSPDLRCLSIGNCDGSVYAAIEQHGHHIKELNIYHSPKPVSLGSHEYCSDHTSGLKHLTVDEFDSPNWLLPLIK